MDLKDCFVVSIAAIFLIGGCFEKTSEEVKEIDPRFVELPDNVAVIGAGGLNRISWMTLRAIELS